MFDDDIDESARNTSLFGENALYSFGEDNGAFRLLFDAPESHFLGQNKGVFSLLSDAYHPDDLEHSTSTPSLSSDAQVLGLEGDSVSPESDGMDLSGVLTLSKSSFFSGFIAEKEDDHIGDLPLKKQRVVEEPIPIVNKVNNARNDSNFITTIKDYFLKGNGRHYFWEKNEDESVIADLFNKNITLLNLSRVFLDIKIIEPVFGHEIKEGDKSSLLDWYLLLEPNSLQDLMERNLHYKSPEIKYLSQPAWVRDVYYESFLAWYLQEALQHQDKYDPYLAIKNILLSRSTDMIKVLLNNVVTDGGQGSQTYLSWYLQDLAKKEEASNLQEAITKILSLRVPQVQRILLEQFIPKTSHQQSWLNWYKHTDVLAATKKILASQCLELINELVLIDINLINQSQCSALEYFINYSTEDLDAIESIFSSSNSVPRCNKAILFLLNKPLLSSYLTYADYYFSKTVSNTQALNQTAIQKITNAYEKLKIAANNNGTSFVLSNESIEIIRHCSGCLKNNQKDAQKNSSKKKAYSVLINKTSTCPNVKKFLKGADIKQVLLVDEETRTGCIMFLSKEPIVDLIFSPKVVAHLRKIHKKDKDLASKIVLPSPQQESAAISLEGSGNKRPRSPQPSAFFSGGPPAKQPKLNSLHTNSSHIFFPPVCNTQGSSRPLASNNKEQSNKRYVN